MSKEYPKDYFKLVQENERLLDKPLQTKQLSYFKDAMLRFTKNKYNVIATGIVLFFILLSIVVPMITPSNLYDRVNSQMASLPPRLPLIEKLGILDGKKVFKDIPIDATKMDEETKLFLPRGYKKEYITLSTLENYKVYGNNSSSDYIGGYNGVYVDSGKMGYATISRDIVTLDKTLLIDINEVVGDSTLKIYISHTNDEKAIKSWDELEFIGEVNKAGILTLDLTDTTLKSGYIVLRNELKEASVKGSEAIILEKVSTLNAKGDTLKEYSGYLLSQFKAFSFDREIENGRYARKDSYYVAARFEYNVYKALFDDVEEIISEEAYESIIAKNPEMLDTMVIDPENPNSWTFGEGFPISSAVKEIGKPLPGIGQGYVQYRVMKNGAYALGFDSVPYFIFGTNIEGKDLFSLVWLGLRTSLIIGVITSIVNTIIGVIWGAISAYYGGQVDMLMERFTDIWGSFPQITMIGIIEILFGKGFWSLFIFLIYDGWIGIAATTRMQFYRYKGREYVLAARTLGASDRRVIFKHILPNALGTIVTRVVLSIPSIIFLEANLSFLGFGIGNGAKLIIGPFELTGTSLGVILSQGQQQLTAGNYWMVAAPTIVIAILMISFNMFGNALRDALNPTLRGAE